MAQSPTPASTLVSAILCFVIARTLENWGAGEFTVSLFWVFFWLCLAGAIPGVFKSVQLLRLVNIAMRPTGLHGRTFLPKLNTVQESPLSFDNQDADGISLGILGGKILFWRGRGHASIRAPTDSGKTESFSAGVCFSLGAHRNLVTTAKGPELALITTPYRRDVLGQNVICVDPWRMLNGTNLKSYDFNPCFNLIGLAEAEDHEIFDEARGIIHALKPEANAGGENAIFRSTGNELLVAFLLFAAVMEAETGELVCNFAHIGRVVSGSLGEVQDFLFDMSQCPALDGEIARMGRHFLDTIEKSEKFAASILTEARDALKIFTTGPLAKSIEYTNFDPSALKKPGKGITIHIVIPPEKLLTHGVYGGLVMNSLAMQCIRAKSFEPRVTFLCDEFKALCNGSSLPFVMPALKVGREMGLQVITLVQDLQGYSTCFGDSATAFTTQSEVVMAWGIRSNEDAESYSKRIGPKSVITETATLPMLSGDQTSHSLSSHEVGVPIYRPDELMQLPKYTAVLFHQDAPGRLIDLHSYRSVDPWVKLAGKVPGASPKSKLRVRFKV